MNALAVSLLAVLCCLAGCKEKEAAAVHACSSGYDRTVFDQCVAACIKCQHGVTTTCSTSCTLKGARAGAIELNRSSLEDSLPEGCTSLLHCGGLS